MEFFVQVFGVLSTHGVVGSWDKPPCMASIFSVLVTDDECSSVDPIVFVVVLEFPFVKWGWWFILLTNVSITNCW